MILDDANHKGLSGSCRASYSLDLFDFHHNYIQVPVPRVTLCAACRKMARCPI